MSGPGELVIVNLDRTIADRVYTHALNDAAEIGLLGKDHRDIPNKPRAAKRHFLEAISGVPIPRLFPLVDKTAERAGERLAPAARLILEAEQKDVRLVSSDVVDFLMEPWAEGIEDAIPGVRVPETDGQPLVMDRGIFVDDETGDEQEFTFFTGETRKLFKTSNIEDLQAAGHTTPVIVDSFTYGTLTKASNRAYAINVVPRLNEQIDNEATAVARGGYDGLPPESQPRLDPSKVVKINWQPDDPTAEVLLPGQLDPGYYDLSRRHGRSDFLHTLGYRTSRTARVGRVLRGAAGKLHR